MNSEQPNNSGGTENTTGKVDEQDNLSHTTAKANSSSTTNAITNSSDKQLPSTGERNTFTIFGTAALMILASVGLVAKKKEQ
ncbi:LPXTG cell wall anchor domain-containing protein [Aerococcaceae bacterium NML160702]|nr:LPXTG cell wall anchor domain-containing protein [Aerococcaceae bacterium NML160702]